MQKLYRSKTENHGLKIRNWRFRRPHEVLWRCRSIWVSVVLHIIPTQTCCEERKCWFISRWFFGSSSWYLQARNRKKEKASFKRLKDSKSMEYLSPFIATWNGWTFQTLILTYIIVYTYRKPNNKPISINKQSNHPQNVLKQLPKSIANRISDTS